MDNSAQTSQSKQQNKQQSQTPVVTSPSGSIAKEQMGGRLPSKDAVEAVSVEVTPPKEVKDAGVVTQQINIAVPPDLQKMGISPSGPSAPVATATTPVVVLPISDQQVVSGLHAQVYSALRWLAEWCIRKLKKAHLTLKVIHGKIMRVSYKKYE